MITIQIKKVRDDEPFCVPSYATEGSACMDVRASLFCGKPSFVTLIPGEVRLIPTNMAVRIPKGYEIQLRPRSGLALKHGITLINAPGTIDSDYRGEIGIALINNGKYPYIISNGDSIAQMLVSKVEKIILDMVTELDCTDRGAGGFGHTGK